MLAKRTIFLILILSTMIIGTSCGLVETVAVGTTADILYKGTTEIETETNWQLFREAIPGNLKMMEGMLYVDPDNEKLLVSLTKGYAGLAFGVNETLYLDEKYRDVSDGPQAKEAVYNYTKAVNYGLRYLAENGVQFEEMQKLINVDNGIVSYLDDNIGDDDHELEGVFYTAQSMGSLIFLKQTDMTMVAQLPIVKGMFDWVCTKRPDFNHGACDIFYGAYEAARPKMLGGNPEKGREIFEKLIKNHPNNWMARTEFLRFYVIPMEEEDLYAEQRNFFKAAVKRFDQSREWVPNGKMAADFEQPRVRLFQSIAIKRMELIRKHEKQIFDF